MHPIQLGQNPSNIEAFLQIREQINFLNRPGKKTDWKLVERLANEIFIDNGMDLQTLCYYTVAQVNLKPNIDLLSNNLETVSIVLMSYWKEIWPEDIQARINSLNWLNKHISPFVIVIDSQQISLKQLYQLEHNLTLIIHQLARHTASFCNLANTLNLVQEKITALTKPTYPLSTTHKNITIKPIPPKEQVDKRQPTTTDNSVSSIKPSLSEEKSEMTTKPEFYLHHSSSMRKSKNYAGYLFCLCLGGILALLINYIYQQSQQNLQQALDNILTTPIYAFQQGEKIIQQSQQGWISFNQVNYPRWQTQLKHYAEIGKNSTSENKLIQQITELQQALLEAERHKKGITISQLKTTVYNIERSANSEQSIEQQLYQYSQSPTDYKLKMTIEQKLMGLLAYYYQLEQEHER